MHANGFSVARKNHIAEFVQSTLAHNPLRGALKAAQWVVGKRGLHEFGDVIFSGDAKVARLPAD